MKYNAAMRNSLDLQSKFREGLPFLNDFVQQARLAGAREYKKITRADQEEQQLRFIPYPTQQAASSFQTFINKEEEKKEAPPVPPLVVKSYE